ncbi:MAG: hypothetical protein HOG49_30965 [Candidatus Scalindua sp.]|jgi:hypothetical protein|nr:hypothetical protein [Candidatus Scalindua sp.]
MSNDLDRVYNKIEKEFGKIHNKLDGMSTEITTHKVLIENCGDDKDALQEVVHGNGKAGLVIEVDRIKTTLKNTGMMKRSLWANVGIIFTCVGVTAAIVFSMMAASSSGKNRFYKRDGTKLEKRISRLELLKEEMNGTN